VEQIHHYPHLGVFEPGDYTGRPKLTAIRRRRWEYFVKARLCLWGRDDIFLDSEKSGTFFGN
ncbi:MAG: hypothetical protein LBS31_12160, partial [Candidatus Adiutrix sp.]|nr:hypothetical protein [Candidatus Adiutrix sp.]